MTDETNLAGKNLQLLIVPIDYVYSTEQDDCTIRIVTISNRYLLKHLSSAGARHAENDNQQRTAIEIF